ncbi:MAG TPA: aminotransferase class IV [Longimicrobiales bacterium]|nr:aminotransferase class IV [Longimicrobiales bacterium]
MIAWVDGEWLDETAASVPITDRGFLGADAVFETARLHDGGYFRLERHLERLEQSAAVLRIPLPPRSTLRDVAFQLAQRNALSDGSLRITVTRGSGSGSFALATIAPVSSAWRERAERGWTLITARVRTPPATVVPHVVKTTGRIWSLLARQEAADAGADDALLLTVDGHVAEGPTWNVFWRRADTLYTPALETGILDGVTRAEVIGLGRALGLQVEEGIYGRDALDYADEILATMSSVGPVNIRVLDRRPLPEPELGPRLRSAYWAAVAAHVERPAGTEPA